MQDTVGSPRQAQLWVIDQVLGEDGCMFIDQDGVEVRKKKNRANIQPS